MTINFFVELTKPKKGDYSLGWYVSVPKIVGDPTCDTFYYLHDDGKVYDYCAGKHSTGWFKTLEKCFNAAVAYYASHNHAYPYVLRNGLVFEASGTIQHTAGGLQGGTVVQSEPMDF